MFKNNNEKCALKIPASEVLQFYNVSDGHFSFLVAKYFFFTYEKRTTRPFFQK